MTRPTRDMLLAEATKQFADMGFDGASIASIARALNLTKQTLLHHFGSKEHLYGEVLEATADRLTQKIKSLNFMESEKRFEAILRSFFANKPELERDGTLIIRELIDNKARLENVDTWYLKPFLAELVTAYKAARKIPNMPDMEALAQVYFFLGAMKYYVASRNTLRHMYDEPSFAQLEAAFTEYFNNALAKAGAH